MAFHFRSAMRRFTGCLGKTAPGNPPCSRSSQAPRPRMRAQSCGTGTRANIANPQAAQALGIVTIYQEFNLVPTLTVAENIFIGREPLRYGRFVDWPRMRAEARAITQRIGLTIDPDALVSNLSVAEQQMVEIARALSARARLIIMDEPTSALSEAEVTRLFAIMRSLKADGVSIMFVTHHRSGGPARAGGGARLPGGAHLERERRRRRVRRRARPRRALRPACTGRPAPIRTPTGPRPSATSAR